MKKTLTMIKKFFINLWNLIQKVDSVLVKHKVYQIVFAAMMAVLLIGFADSFTSDTIYRNYKTNSIREVQLKNGNTYTFAFEAQEETLNCFRVFTNQKASKLETTDKCHIFITDDEGTKIYEDDVNLYNYGRDYIEFDCNNLKLTSDDRYYVTFSFEDISDSSYLIIRTHQAQTFDEALAYSNSSDASDNSDDSELITADNVDATVSDVLSFDVAFGFSTIVNVAYYYSSVNIAYVFIYILLFAGIATVLFFPKIFKATPTRVIYRYLVIPILIYLMAEVLNIENTRHINFLFPMTPKHIFCLVVSLAILGVLSFFIYMLTGFSQIGSFVVLLACAIVAFVNHTKLVMRGDTFMPWDIFSAGIAAKTGSTFYFRTTFQLIAGILICLMVLIVIRLTSGHYLKFSKERFALIASSGLIIALIMFSCVLNRGLLDRLGIYYAVYPPMQSYNENGTYLAFLMHLNNIEADGKDANSPEATDDLIYEYAIEARRERLYENTADSDIQPNVICIMSEAYSDINTIREITTSEPVAPFMDSLKESSIYGNIAVSILGGGTCNTEFEFLTGYSMASLLPGSSVYTFYVNDTVESALPYLYAQEGYRTVALHPFDEEWWDRSEKYPLLGFQEFYSQDDFDPSTTSYVRRYISDLSTFHMITDIYDSSEDPLFLFCVTMQNHADFSARYDNMAYNITIEGLLNEDGEHFTYAENYLSLIRESDDALQYLINYLSESDEPTIVVFFGDHRPTLDENFYDTLLDCDFGTITLDESLSLYQTPYFVWANYDLSEMNTSLDLSYGDHGITCPEFLGQTILDISGIESPDERSCLRVLQQHILAISSLAVYDQSGVAYTDFATLPDDIRTMVDDYAFAQYGQIFYTEEDDSVATIE